MKEVHFVTQSKGGVGKSFVAMLLAQYLQDHAEDKLFCFDTDPDNPIFAGCQALKAKYINIKADDRPVINIKKFDGLLDTLIDDKGIAVIDTGTSTFDPLMTYIAEADVDAMLINENVRMVMHVPLNGGQAKNECIKGLARVLSSIDAQVVVWLNEHLHGEIQEQGKPFEEFEICNAYRNKIAGIVRIPVMNADTYGDDIKQMTEYNATFHEVAKNTNADFGRWTRTRLAEFRNIIWAELDRMPFLASQAWHKKHTLPEADKPT